MRVKCIDISDFEMFIDGSYVFTLFMVAIMTHKCIDYYLLFNVNNFKVLVV